MFPEHDHGQAQLWISLTRGDYQKHAS